MHRVPRHARQPADAGCGGEAPQWHRNPYHALAVGAVALANEPHVTELAQNGVRADDMLLCALAVVRDDEEGRVGGVLEEPSDRRIELLVQTLVGRYGVG